MYGLSDHLNGIPRTRFRAVRQGSSRYSALTLASIEHPFEPGGRGRCPAADAAHCRAARATSTATSFEGDDGWTLVDTGLGLGDPDERSGGRIGDVAAIVVTHLHPDHIGGAVGAAEITGAPTSTRAGSTPRSASGCGEPWTGRSVIADWFLRHGVPEPIADDLIERGHAYAPFVRSRRGRLVLDGGHHRRLGGRRAARPRRRAHRARTRRCALGGDHLLPSISPAVGLYPESRPDPLGDYLASLELTIGAGAEDRAPRPRRPVADPAGACARAHRAPARRLEETAAALSAEPRTGYEVSLALFGEATRPQRALRGRRDALAPRAARPRGPSRAGAKTEGTVSYTASSLGRRATAQYPRPGERGVSDFLRVILVLVLVLGNALFVAAEYALVSARRSRLEETSGGGAARRRRTALMDEPGPLHQHRAGRDHGLRDPARRRRRAADLGLLRAWLSRVLAFALSFALLTYLSVVLGELVPKAIALQRAERSRDLASPSARPPRAYRPPDRLAAPGFGARARAAVRRRPRRARGLLVYSREDVRRTVAEAEDVGDRRQLQLQSVR